MFDQVSVKLFLLGMNILVIVLSIISWGFYFKLKEGKKRG